MSEAFTDSISSLLSFLAQCFFFFFPFLKFPALCKHEKAVLLAIQIRISVHSLHKVFSPKSEFHPGESENIINSFVYVANQLARKGYAEKEGNDFVLTSKGRRYIKRNIEFYERNELLSTYNLKDPALVGSGK